MEIDQNAPMAARKEIVIAAPNEKVWQVLTDIDHWSEWQSDVTTAKLDGELKKGTGFRWKAKGLNIVSRLQLVQPGERIGWTGDSVGMKAIHIWKLTSEGVGTRVTTEESLSGWLTRLMKLFDPTFLEKSLEASLQILKNRVEEKEELP